MRGIPLFVIVCLIVGGCGIPGDAGEERVRIEDAGSDQACQDFIDATESLADQPDYRSYVEVLQAAAAPFFDYLFSFEVEMSQEAMLGAENLGFGEPTPEDLVALEEAGALFASDQGTICEKLSANIGFMPPPPGLGWVTPPPVQVESVYPIGSIDHACDVFIQTIDGWSELRSRSEEIGVAIAELTDQVIDTLRANGVEDGLDELAIYSDKYRNVSIVQANEEGEQHLATASRQLAQHSDVCGHLSVWSNDENGGFDLQYNITRWVDYGFDTYTYHLSASDEAGPRDRETYLVVVVDGTVSEVYNIRTAESTSGPADTPLTVLDMFAFIDVNKVQSASFDPVNGHPQHVRLSEGQTLFSVWDLSQGSDFDRSILGSTADVRVVVEAIDEFVPGKACGNARVPPGLEIPGVQPLDDDAQQALDDLASNDEGGLFTDNYEYGIFERTDEYLVLLGESDTGDFSDAAFVWEDGQWKLHSWGQCHWSDDGYHLASWDLDPESDLDMTGSTLELILDDSCGTTTRFGNKILVVVEGDDAKIAVIVWQAANPPPPPPGSPDVFYEASCSIGIVVQLGVILNSPVGDREIVGSTPRQDWTES